MSWLCAVGDFVAQHQEFDVLGCRRAAEQQQQVQQPKEDQVEQTQQHGSRSCPAGQAHRSSRSAAQADFWNPTGWAEWAGPATAGAASSRRSNWESSTLRRYSSLDNSLLTELIGDAAWSNEGLLALLQGLRRLCRLVNTE